MRMRWIASGLAAFAVLAAGVAAFRPTQDPPATTSVDGTGVASTTLTAETHAQATPLPSVATPSSSTSLIQQAPSVGPPPPAPQPAIASGFDGKGLVVAAAGGASIAGTPDGTEETRIREGLPLAGLDWDGEWIRVLTPCDTTRYVHRSEVTATPPAPDQPIGSGFRLGDAVIVVDPGHGGPNIGAVSPFGDREKDVNVEIAHRLRDLLGASRDIDWVTGAVTPGETIDAAGTVLVTRAGAGSHADYEAGLIYRAALADAAGAHVMISIHNNAGWDIRLETPGSDAYYQSDVVESRRLAVLVVDELGRSFSGFDADWVGTDPVGAKSRLSPRDGTSQYYGLLKSTSVPTVIAEGAYIVNPTEAMLLSTDDFRHAYAEGLYRAVVRFLTSEEAGSAVSYDPEVWTGTAGRGGASDECVLPVHPTG